MKQKTAIILNAFLVYLITLIGLLLNIVPLNMIFWFLTFLYILFTVMKVFYLVVADKEDSKKLNTKIFENPEKVELIERRHKLVLDFLDYGVTTQEKALEKIDIIDKQLKLIDGKN